MIINRKKIINLAKKFIDICEKNHIWYSLDYLTLLGAKKHSGFVPWHERFDVMIKVDGYNKLKRLFNNNIIDSSVEKKYKKLSLSFVENNLESQKEQPFINIRVAIPTNIKKLKKFTSFFYSIKKLFKIIPSNIKQVINELQDKNSYQGYYLLDSNFSQKNNHWIQVLTGNVLKINFAGINANIICEADIVLKEWFGENYMKKNVVPFSWKIYKSPFLNEKEV